MHGAFAFILYTYGALSGALGYYGMPLRCAVTIAVIRLAAGLPIVQRLLKLSRCLRRGAVHPVGVLNALRLLALVSGPSAKAWSDQCRLLASSSCGSAQCPLGICLIKWHSDFGSCV